MKKILWLVSWYPNRIEPLNGDFIERHAKAVSLFDSISVLHVVKDHLDATPGKLFTEKRTYNGNCEASVIYYKVRFEKIKWLNRAISALQFFKHFIRAANQYITQKGRPDLIHVHISLKAGLVALYFKRKYKIPYVVSEQWTGFCPEAKPNFDELHWLFRWLWKKVMREASGCTAVSTYLGESLRSRLRKLNYEVIPNVVDVTIFKPVAHQHDGAFRFLHVSTLSPQKNPRQILEAIRILSSCTDKKFELIIYGFVNAELAEMTYTLGIREHITFKGEASQTVIARDMQQADAFILYSGFETFGCVIIEANACGVPVLVSDIPVLHENVRDGVTGVFVPLNAPEILAERMLFMMQNIKKFNPEQIAELTRNKYSFAVVGKQFDLFYESVLGAAPNI